MEKLKQNHDVQIKWVAFPLAPHNPLEGIALTEYFRKKGVAVDLPDMMRRLGGVAAAEGLPFGPRTHSYNSRRAHELGKWASEQGKGEAFHMAMFKEYFAEGRNIADLAVLRQAVQDIGLDPDQAQAAVEGGGYAQAVDDDWALCRKLGIQAAPTFVMNKKTLVGAQPYEMLEQLVTGSGSALM